MAAKWLVVAVGLWLFVAPWTLHYVSGAATGNDMILGMLVFGTAVWSMGTSAHPALPAAAQLLLGAWLAAAPWTVGYSILADHATLNDVASGVSLIALAAYQIVVGRRLSPAGTVSPPL